MNLPVIVIGGGGHARVLMDALLLQSEVILGFTDSDPNVHGRSFRGISCLGDDQRVLDYAPSEVRLVNAIGSVGSTRVRQRIYESFSSKGYEFASVIHPSAILALDVVLGEGVQIMAGAVLQTGTSIGDNSIVNTRASIDHDCVIGSHVHIAPGATLSGGITVENGVHIGCGATIIQQVRLHEQSVIGAGAVVIHHVPANCTYVGVPAKEVSK